jgi:hypothetical protein
LTYYKEKQMPIPHKPASVRKIDRFLSFPSCSGPGFGRAFCFQAAALSSSRLSFLSRKTGSKGEGRLTLN